MESDPHLEPNDGLNESSPAKKTSWFARSFKPFRTATLRGLAVILPPLLTIMFFIWAWNVIEVYVLKPAESALTAGVAYFIEDVHEPQQVVEGLAEQTYTLRGKTVVTDEGVELTQIESGQWIPSLVYQTAIRQVSEKPLASARDYFRSYVQVRYLKRHLFIPTFLALFLALLYLLGKLLAAGIGRILLHYLEHLITQLPIIRNVYSSVKQVTDFALNENEMTFTRIVAVEYPRRGIWSMGFVTGEGMRDIKTAAGEPILTVLMPTSPMPATGFTISIPKSETIDLNITIDQAIQFCVSCGVVIPDHQQPGNTIDGEVRSRFRQLAQSAQSDSTAPSRGNGTTSDSSAERVDVGAENQDN